MATTPSDSAEAITGIARQPLFLTGDANKFLFENDETVEIHDPHPLFDIPVMETYDAFLENLFKKNADRTFGNDYDGADVLCFKAERALSTVLTLNQLEQQSIEKASAEVTDLDEFDQFTDFASLWFEAFANHYNRILHEETPATFDTLRESAQALAENGQIEPELIVKTIAAELDVPIDSYL